MRAPWPQALVDAGFRVVSGGTDTHLLLLDVFSKGLRGKEAEKALDRARITVNKNAIPFDTNPPMNPSGIRLGSPAVTTRGFREAEMREVGALIAEGADATSRTKTRCRGAAEGGGADRQVPALQLEARLRAAHRMSHIVIDARRIRDFGIGTYIRNLVHALGGIDTTTSTPWSADPPTCGRWPACREISTRAVYGAATTALWTTWRSRCFLRGLSPDLVHIPLNRVPLLMIRPYVVTIHDMASLLFGEEAHSPTRMQLAALSASAADCSAPPRDRGLGSHRRDVENLLGIPPDRICRGLQRARSRRSWRAAATRPWKASAHPGALPDHYPFLLYAGNIRRQKNIPRLVEAFAVVREHLAVASGVQGSAPDHYRRQDFAISRRCGGR